MTVNTKYNVGDRLHYLEENKIYLNEVIKVTIESSKAYPNPKVLYLFANNPKAKYENEISVTKEGLLDLIPVTNITSR